SFQRYRYADGSRTSGILMPAHRFQWAMNAFGTDRRIGSLPLEKGEWIPSTAYAFELICAKPFSGRQRTGGTDWTSGASCRKSYAGDERYETTNECIG